MLWRKFGGLCRFCSATCTEKLSAYFRFPDSMRYSPICTALSAAPFANLIAREPECQTVGIGKIFTETTHVNIVLVGSEEGHGIFAVLGIVHELLPWLRQRLCGLRQRLSDFRFQSNAFAVGTQRRHTHAGGTRNHIAVHYLARFVVHLHFLLGIVVVREHVNLGESC